MPKNPINILSLFRIQIFDKRDPAYLRNTNAYRHKLKSTAANNAKALLSASLRRPDRVTALIQFRVSNVADRTCHNTTPVQLQCHDDHAEFSAM